MGEPALSLSTESQQESVYKFYKTLGDFHRSSAEVRLLGGPGGVGKTVAMLKDSQMIGQAQEVYYSYEYPQGVRHTKFLFVRKTRGEIKAAIIDVMSEWFSSAALTIWTQPDRAEYKYIDGDGHTVLMEYSFLGLDDDDAMSKIDSLGWTQVYLNEGHHMTEFQHSRLVFRGRRFPVNVNGVSWTNGGCAIDFNPPDLGHWIAKKYILERMTGEGGEILSEVFMVPPPIIRKKGNFSDGTYINGYTYYRNPADEASFLQDRYVNGMLIPGYKFWMNKIKSLNDRDIRSLILGEFIPVRDGKPVYENYSEEKHLAPGPLAHNVDRPLELAFDFGHNAACVIGQPLDDGRYGILREIYEGDVGLAAMMEALGPILKRDFEGMFLDVVYDPSNKKLEGRNDLRQSQRVQAYLIGQGFRCHMKPSINEWEARQGSMQTLIDMERALVIDRSCTRVRNSLMGEYCYPKKRASDGFHPRPDKNDPHSHVMDCCEYLAVKRAKLHIKKKTTRVAKRKSPRRRFNR